MFAKMEENRAWGIPGACPCGTFGAFSAERQTWECLPLKKQTTTRSIRLGRQFCCVMVMCTKGAGFDGAKMRGWGGAKGRINAHGLAKGMEQHIAHTMVGIGW